MLANPTTVNTVSSSSRPVDADVINTWPLSNRPEIDNRLKVGDRLSVSLVPWRVSVKPLRVRQAEATRSLLIEVARQNFTQHGYAATSIDDSIQQAGVARGALYHHFPGKEALFRAVYETVEGEVVARVMQAAASQASPWDAVRAGLSTFLDA